MKCKHCGNDEKFYQKVSFTGSGKTFFDNHGKYLEDGTNSDLYMHIKHIQGKYLYCNECGKRMIAIDDIE